MRSASSSAAIDRLGTCLPAAWAGVAVLASYAGLSWALTVPGLRSPGGWWALDGHRVLDAAAKLAAGHSAYDVPGYFYSPVSTMLTVPWTSLPPWVAIGIWQAIGVVLVVGSTLLLTPSLPILWRALAAAGALFALPTVADLVLANATIPLAVAMALVIRTDGTFGGVSLGLLAAAVPKPMLLPFALWSVVWRPRAAAAAAITGTAATLVGLVLLGPREYLRFLQRLQEGTRVDFIGNNGLSLVSVPLANVAALVAGVGLLIVLRRRGEVSSLGWAAASGLFLAPYLGGYAGLPVIAALPLLARRAPGLMVFVALFFVAAGFLYPVSGAVVMISALLIPDEPASGQTSWRARIHRSAS